MSYLFNNTINQNFVELSTKFLFLNSDNLIKMNSNHVNKNEEELNCILNELNSLDYKITINMIDPVSAVRLIQSIVKLEVTKETLVVKACYLIVSLIKYQKINLDDETLNMVIDWLLKALNKSIVCDIFDTLHVLIKGNSHKISKFYDVLFSPEGVLVKSLIDSNLQNRKKESYETNTKEAIKLSAIFCIESFLMYWDENNEINIPIEYIRYIGINMLNVIFHTKSESYAENSYCRLMTSGLNICRIVCLLDDDFANDKLGELIGAAKAFMMFNIPNATKIAPQKLMSSQQTILEPKVVGKNIGGKVVRTRKPRTFNKTKKEDTRHSKSNKYKEKTNSAYESSGLINIETELSKSLPFFRTSDSDFSENETNRIQLDHKRNARLRQTALVLLAAVANATEKRVFFGYWHCLFPLNDVSSSNEITISLLNCVLKDSSPPCRIAALQTIAVIFYGSKLYLDQADMSDKPPSTFTPFSIALGNMITSIFIDLTEAMSNEGSFPVLMQILKCLTVLIQATPINRLKIEILQKIVVYVKQLIYHKDCSIQVAALIVMGILISSSEITTDILEIAGVPKSSSVIFTHKGNLQNFSVQNIDLFTAEDDELELDGLDSDEEPPSSNKNQTSEENSSLQSKSMPWLLQKVLKNLGISSHEIQIQQLVAPTPVRVESLQVLSAMSVHFILLKDNLSFISKALKNCFKCDNHEIKLITAKCLESIGNGIISYFFNQEVDNQEVLNSALNFWLQTIPSVLEQIQSADTSAALKSKCCDALRNIGLHVFERLPEDKHIALISVLSGAGCSEENTVKAAAVRALAVYAQFPTLNEDLCFMENTAESIIRLMNEDSLQIRMKASWSLGTITDVLRLNPNIDNSYDKINDDLLKRLIETTIKYSDQPDTIRPNIMRSIGNLLKLLTNKHFEQQRYNDLFFDSIEKLITHGLNKGITKVKWNTCYAIGNILKNNHIYGINNVQKFQNLVYPPLCNIIVNCSNFKVRTNGAIALTTPTERKHYGQHFIKIWSSLLLALEKSDDLIDFNEYKHRDNLMDQLCLSMSHILDLIIKDDLVLIANELIPKMDIITQHWIRVINRVLPEKGAPLLAISVALKNYDLCNLNAEQKSAIHTLTSCFVPITEYV